VRVRHLGEKALVQVSPSETPRLNDLLLQAKLTPALTAVGFGSVEFDTVGYQGAGLR
jgi:PP-loop superfamily ATP-utilizing enzyme